MSALLPYLLRGVTVLIALVMLIPIIFVVIYTIATGWEASYQLIVRPRVGELLFNTLRLVVATRASGARSRTARPTCAVLGFRLPSASRRWRTRQDSNLWPLPSEGNALSS